MADPFVAEIRPFAFNFAPRGWAFCNGQLLPLSQNTALFSLLGTTFGGDGKTTFGLPNLQGSVAMGQGSGPGLSLRDLGETGGEENHTLLAPEMPSHTHLVNTGNLAAAAKAKNAPGNSPTPVGNVPAVEAAGITATYSTAAPNGTMAAGAIALSGTPAANPAGGGGAHNNLQPYLVINYCIALQGVYPPRT